MEMLYRKRKLTNVQKEKVIAQQISCDNLLRCYISGEIINSNEDEIEFDHLNPFSHDGVTSLINMRAVKKKYNREKGTMSLVEYRKYFMLKRFLEKKNNVIKLQDIFEFKSIVAKKFDYQIIDNGKTIVLYGEGGVELREKLRYEENLNAHYFYARVPFSWLENDDMQGLQPRILDFKRLNQLRIHLRDYPQLLPSIARLIDNKIKLFDGQHKLAAQILNDNDSIDIKLYISPENKVESDLLYEKLLKTNLDAHSKLAQAPFYTNTLFQKWNEMYQIKWNEYLGSSIIEDHTEACFMKFLEKNDKQEARKMFIATVIKNAHDDSVLKKYTAEPNKNSNLPLSQDLLKKTIFKHTLSFNPSIARIDSNEDYRNDEKINFDRVSKMIVKLSGLDNWTSNKKEMDLERLKVRRIWHKGSVLSWSPYLSDIINVVFRLFDQPKTARTLYRPVMTEQEEKQFYLFLERLFKHPFWSQNDSTIDKALTAATNVQDILVKNGLTLEYITTGD